MLTFVIHFVRTVQRVQNTVLGCPFLFLLVGPVSLSTPAQLVAPCVVVKGTLSITASELYFEIDEEEPSFKKIDPKVRDL